MDFHPTPMTDTTYLFHALEPRTRTARTLCIVTRTEQTSDEKKMTLARRAENRCTLHTYPPSVDVCKAVMRVTSHPDTWHTHTHTGALIARRSSLLFQVLRNLAQQQKKPREKSTAITPVQRLHKRHCHIASPTNPPLPFVLYAPLLHCHCHLLLQQENTKPRTMGESRQWRHRPLNPASRADVMQRRLVLHPV